ncbi:hypothetical protein Pst134EA_014915 [Puccinia striiformis f. sp. tritici]|uniref:hypothetical protein n=1 Tax=Puccinia striiformis f. sp. tritici TaxID=168172 RepID=UPI002007A065|nr:hypothetical protein Pst134EA_014915 [Puccinia striiformis f. sp. tritici]KAH9462825.1 hypothetical protein Pst134EA_014915 [Puccinia striiformis f. sp. tritici]
MPSRPPLLSELTPSTSGIVSDPNTGDRKVAPSKRPDGTLRKEIKIRPGFTPQEDVSKFRSARQSEFESKKLPKGSVVGLTRPQVAVAQSALRGMSDAQKKNAKRKEKRKTELVKPGVEDTPDQWDCSSTGSNPQDHPTSGSVNQVKSTPDPLANSNTSRLSQGKVNPGKALFQSALKSSSSNPETPALQHLVPPLQPLEEDHTIPSTNKKESSGKEGIKLFTSAVKSIEDSESMEKRARAIHKKLTQAEQLKVRQEAGETLLAEQLDKITKIDELQLELESMKLDKSTR